MRIKDITIYGFGQWVDHQFTFSSSEITTIYGENESGKSTLQQFILFMLFGMSPKQRKFYQPKNSSKMGGRMTIMTPEYHRIIIERIDDESKGKANCILEDGSEKDEQWLTQLLNGIGLDTYRSIFSFSDTDLVHIRTMQEEELNEILLSIGLTGSSIIYDVERRLDQEIGSLYKPSGRKPEINEQLTSLQQESKKLDELRKNENTYHEKVERQQYLQQRYQTTQQEIMKLRQERRELDTLIQALPLLKEAKIIQSQLHNSKHIADFPEHGVERMDQYRELVLPLRSERSTRISNIEKYHEKILEVKELLLPTSTQEQLNELLGQYNEVQFAIEEKKRLVKLIAKQKARLEEETQQLHVNLTISELNQLALPFYLEKQWGKIRSNAEQLFYEKQQLEQQNSQLIEEKVFLEGQHKKVNNQLLHEAHVDELRQRIDAYQTSQVLQAENQKMHQKWQRTKHHKKRLNKQILYSSIVLASIFMLTSFVFTEFWLAILSIIVIGFGFSIMRINKQTIDMVNGMSDANDSNDVAFVDVTTEEYHEARNILEEQEALQKEIEQINKKIQDNELALMEWKRKQTNIYERLEQLDKQKQEQASLYPFLVSIDVDYWPELFHHLQRLLQLNEQLQENERHSLQESTKIDHYIMRCEQWSIDNHQQLDVDDPETVLAQLQEINEQHNHALQDYQHYRAHRQEERTLEQQLSQSIEVYQESIDKLLEQANVPDEDSFYENAKLYKEVVSLRERNDKLQNQLITIFPDGFESNIKRLETNEYYVKKQEKQNVILKELEEEIEDIRNDLAEVQATINSLEGSSELSRKTHQVELEKEKLNGLFRQWAIRKVAKSYLVEAKKNYRDQYLTSVIHEAMVFFSDLTDERYVKIYAPTKNQGFMVETKEQRKFLVNELSQGTIDQLYISLRFAISKIMSQQYLMPFLIDDALVHFDSKRMERVVDILRGTAKNQQVILFTCKEEIMQLVDGEVLQL
ncbi:AAA family ATPase [Oceanobacillus sp. 1P07AA]|uniref:ATP-binding protein n=1 Tax=Oceanobacillus sp. 1P07AA TaxID=3132293 RepID=UPI0039A6D5CC